MVRELIIPLITKIGANSELIYYYSGQAQCPPRFFWGPGLRDHYVLHYICSGSGTFRVNDASYELEAGQLFLICPDTLVYYEASEEAPWQYVWAGFNGIKAGEFLRRAGLDAENPVLSCSNGEEIQACMELLLEAEGAVRNRDLKLTGLLYQLIGLLSEQAGAAQRPASSDAVSLQELYLNKSMEFIYKNYSRRLTVADIAAYVGIDRKYLHYIFKQNGHLSPKEVLTQFRLTMACELLKKRKLPVGHVARSVGYDDPLQFTRVFHKYKGLSPTEWRMEQGE